MKPVTLLVSGASGVVGYGTLRSLRKANPAYKLIGTSIYDDSVAPAFCDCFEQAPKTIEPHYIDWLVGVIAKHKVDMIIPGIEIDMQTWSQARGRLAQSGAKLMLNNPDLINLCADKWSFYQALGAEHPLAIPTTLSGDYANLKAKFGLPFLFKPRAGFAAKGIVRITDEDVFSRYSAEFGSKLMAQQLIGTDQEEYTTSAFFDGDSQLCCFMTLQRQLAAEGYTEKARVVTLPEIEPAIRDLADRFKPVGPTNFQFRRHQGQLKLLEINPRISSSTTIRSAFGYNETEMAVQYYLFGTKPSQPAIRDGYAVRYVDEVIFT